MTPPKDSKDLHSRFDKAKRGQHKRNAMVNLSREMYEMTWMRTSGYLDPRSVEWRAKIPHEYYSPNNRPKDVVDMMTAILSGNLPQYKVTQPGHIASDAPSRAERFIKGLWMLNSQRHGFDVYRKWVFDMVQDGSAGLRIYWNTNYSEPHSTEPTEDGDYAIATWKPGQFPIVMEPIDIRKLYPFGRGQMGRPFDELFHVEKRTPYEVAYEWEGIEGASMKFMDKFLTEDKKREHEGEYIEWWGQDAKGQVMHAIMYEQEYVLAPRVTEYTEIPYILVEYQHYEKSGKDFMPFLYGMFHSSNKEEWLQAKLFRLIDMISSLPPMKKGGSRPRWAGTWGKVSHLKDGESIEFPKFPGTPPDIYRGIEMTQEAQQMATFSNAAFGQLSQRVSGYAYNQMASADTIRTDLPRSNLELALVRVANVIFSILQVKMPDTQVSIHVVDGNKELTSVLAGKETEYLSIAAIVNPKQLADEARNAALGMQLASAPNPVLSRETILEKYFNQPQPEEEITRILIETALQDPIIKRILTIEMMQEENHELLPLVQQMFQQEMAMLGGGPGGPPTPPEGPPGVGMGMDQQMMGNAPAGPGGMNPMMENPNMASDVYMGGPVE